MPAAGADPREQCFIPYLAGGVMLIRTRLKFALVPTFVLGIGAVKLRSWTYWALPFLADLLHERHKPSSINQPGTEPRKRRLLLLATGSLLA